MTIPSMTPEQAAAAGLTMDQVPPLTAEAFPVDATIDEISAGGLTETVDVPNDTTEARLSAIELHISQLEEQISALHSRLMK